MARFYRPTLLATVLIPIFLAFGLHYATLPVPDDLSTVDQWTMRLIAIGVDLGRLPLGWLGVNAAIWMLGSWNIRNVIYTDTYVDGVKVRIYKPIHKTHRPMAGMVFVHGGGWVYGNVESYHGLTGYLASELQIVLVSIDYRNPPAHVFPSAIEDATTATVWFLRHASKYNVNSDRIALVGDSCGGNLAAAVAQRLTFQDGHKRLPKLKFQGLIYPVLQALDFNLPSYQQNGDQSTLVARKDTMVEFWSTYMLGNHGLVEYFLANNHTFASKKQNSSGSEIVSHKRIPEKFKYKPYTPASSTTFSNDAVYSKIESTLFDPDFAPLMRANLSGLPPTYVLTAQHDILRDEGILYVQRLQEAGVQVTWNNYKHGVHGIFSMFAVPGISIESGRQCMRDFLNYARQTLLLNDKTNMKG